MATRMNGIPDDTSVVIPRLVCREPAAEIDFCVRTFGASELGRRADAHERVIHALMRIGPAMLMIEAEWPSLPGRVPAGHGTSPVIIFVYVEDVDRTIERAVAGGAAILVPLQDQFWGDRTAWILDPAGHIWTVASRIEETTAQERDTRWSDSLKERPD